MRKANCQDLVVIRLPGKAQGTFQLRIDTVWSCRVLLLFSSKHDEGSQQHDCALVSALEEYTGPRRPSWLDQADSKMIYERKNNQQVLYVFPITSILPKLPVVPVKETGTIPFSM